jgi:hypothetical protein
MVFDVNSRGWQALQGGVREKVELATKFGIASLDGDRQIRGDPEYVRAACEGSLARLGVDCIDLYYQHRIDNNVPVEITVRVQNEFLLTPFFFPNDPKGSNFHYHQITKIHQILTHTGEDRRLMLAFRRKTRTSLKVLQNIKPLPKAQGITARANVKQLANIKLDSNFRSIKTTKEDLLSDFHQDFCRQGSYSPDEGDFHYQHFQKMFHLCQQTQQALASRQHQHGAPEHLVHHGDLTNIS